MNSIKIFITKFLLMILVAILVFLILIGKSSCECNDFNGNYNETQLQIIK